MSIHIESASLCHWLMQHNRDSACSQVLIQAFVHPNTQKKSLFTWKHSPRRPSAFSFALFCTFRVYYVDPVPGTSKPLPLITKGIPKIHGSPHLQRLNSLQPQNRPIAGRSKLRNELHSEKYTGISH